VVDSVLASAAHVGLLSAPRLLREPLNANVDIVAESPPGDSPAALAGLLDGVRAVGEPAELVAVTEASLTQAERTALNPPALSLTDAARLLSAGGNGKVTVEMLQADVEAGAPTNADGTVNLVRYAAWLNMKRSDVSGEAERSQDGED